MGRAGPQRFSVRLPLSPPRFLRQNLVILVTVNRAGEISPALSP